LSEEDRRAVVAALRKQRDATLANASPDERQFIESVSETAAGMLSRARSHLAQHAPDLLARMDRGEDVADELAAYSATLRVGGPARETQPASEIVVTGELRQGRSGIQVKLNEPGTDNRTVEVPAGINRVLWLLLPRERREEVLGDFQEDYSRVHKRFGRKYAAWWSVAELFRTVLPSTVTWVWRFVVLKGILGVYRYFAG
jgi:hypothetical protein